MNKCSIQSITFAKQKKTKMVFHYHQNKCKTNFKIKSKGIINPQPTL